MSKISSLPKEWAHSAIRMFFEQQTDPWAVIEQIYESGARALWVVRLGGVSLLFGFLASLVIRDPGIGPLGVILAAQALFFINLGTSGTIMITQHARFWLAYLFSPLSLVVTLLYSLIAFRPFGSELFLLSLYFVIGIQFAVTGTVWVHKRTYSVQQEQSRWRAGGVVADLPVLPLWKRVRTLRLVSTLLPLIFLFSIFIIELYYGYYNFNNNPIVVHDDDPFLIYYQVIAVYFHLLSRGNYILLFIMIWGSFTAGVLRLDATLACLLGLSPLVAYNPATGKWRATYSGRFALFVPMFRLRQVILTDGQANVSRSDKEASAAILALFREGTLAPTLCKFVATLEPAKINAILLHLSLQTGGATVLNDLQSGLPAPQRAIAEQYAALASEAAKPTDLQQWLNILPTPSEQKVSIAMEESSLQERVTQLLTQTHEVLLSYEFSPLIDETRHNLEQFIAALSIPSEPASWPIALLDHVDSQRGRLKVVEN